MATEIKHWILAEPGPGQAYSQVTVTEGEGAVFALSNWTFPGGYQAPVAVAQFESGGHQYTHPLLLIVSGSALPGFAEGWEARGAIVVNNRVLVLYVGPSKPAKD